MHLPRKIREFYDSDGEVPIWNGEPNAMPVSRITHPIIMFVTFVGIVLLLWAAGWSFSKSSRDPAKPSAAM